MSKTQVLLEQRHVCSITLVLSHTKAPQLNSGSKVENKYTVALHTTQV